MDKAIVDRLCTRIDLIESWGTLVDAYEQMRFLDPLDDTTRLEEFQYITRELNRNMGAWQKALIQCESIEDALDWLMAHRDPAGQVKITERKQVAYQAFRARWFANSLGYLVSLLEQESNEEE